METKSLSPYESHEGEGSGRVSGFEDVKKLIAEKLHRTAGELSNKSRGSNQELGEYGDKAAVWLDKSADYIQNFDVQKLDADVKAYVRKKPGVSLLIAGAAGLILGALLRRR